VLRAARKGFPTPVPLNETPPPGCGVLVISAPLRIMHTMIEMK
jgi:hypothetical protein